MYELLGGLVKYDIGLPEASDLIGKKIPESYLDVLKPGFFINCDGSQTIWPVVINSGIMKNAIKVSKNPKLID